MADIEAARRRLTERVIDMDGIEGTAIGLDGDEKCLKVMVSSEEAARKVPSVVGGFRVVVEKTGKFHRQD